MGDLKKCLDERREQMDEYSKSFGNMNEQEITEEKARLLVVFLEAEKELDKCINDVDYPPETFDNVLNIFDEQEDRLKACIEEINLREQDLIRFKEQELQKAEKARKKEERKKCEKKEAIKILSKKTREKNLRK